MNQSGVIICFAFNGPHSLKLMYHNMNIWDQATLLNIFCDILSENKKTKIPFYHLLSKTWRKRIIYT